MSTLTVTASQVSHKPANVVENKPAPSGPFITTRAAGRLAGVSYQTVRRLMADGLIEGFTLESGHRRVSEPSLRDWFGLSSIVGNEGADNTAGRIVLVYARVSTQKQKAEGNLERQTERLKTFAESRYTGQTVKVIAEVGSGLSDQRQGFLKLVELLSAGRVSALVCEYRDRIARFGVGVVQRLCEAHKTEFVESKTGDEVEHATTAEQEMAKDVLAILSVYSNRAMGKRGADKNRLVVPVGFRERVATLYGQGLGRREIIAAIVAEGWKCENTAKPLGECSVRNVLRDVQQTAIPQVLRTFVREVCVCSAGRRAMTGQVWDAFQGYAARKSVDVSGITRGKFWDLMKVAAKGVRIEKHNGEKRVCGLGLKAGKLV